ncbi:MAG: DUF1538 domain-containing protein [Pseudohongiella sp.]|nr:DUF1538 domain-containing protein [Pseudohongiella sp.]MDO9520305.1 DUF1538 domain-containing protein [Pseudohongiella sp.]
MSELLQSFLGTTLSTLRDVAPIALVVIVFQLFVLRRRLPDAGTLVLGFGCVLLGLVFFLMGLETALFPLGRTMAEQLVAPEFLASINNSAEPLVGHWREYYWLYLFAFAIGTSAVIVEPAVIAVAMKASELSAGAINATALRLVIALGVGVGVALGTFRIVSGISLPLFIGAAYAIVVLQTFFTPRKMIPLAYDSGGVSTSTVTVPIVVALGLGLAANIPDRSPLIDGFGMIAFAVLFPIISVMTYAQLAAWWTRRVKRNNGGK